MGRAVLDLVWGFIAFAVVLAVSFITRQHQDIRSFLGATCVAFFAAALLRANPRRGRPWLTVLLVALGGIVPVVTMNRLGIAFTAGPFIASFLLMSVCAAILGMGIRCGLRSEREQGWAKDDEDNRRVVSTRPDVVPVGRNHREKPHHSESRGDAATLRF